MSQIAKPIILASNSPRRQDLLQLLNFSFKVEQFSFNEDVPSEINAKDAAAYIALKKMKQIPMQQDTIYITSDTTVVVDDVVLGKPKDKEEAKKMLRLLSNREHAVISGVAIGENQKVITSFSEQTKVFFKDLSDSEIDFYVEQYAPFDKAGAYGIQEWIGMIGVTKIEGSYFNVMGLPTQQLNTVLTKLVRP